MTKVLAPSTLVDIQESVTPQFFSVMAFACKHYLKRVHTQNYLYLPEGKGGAELGGCLAIPFWRVRVAALSSREPGG